MKPPEEWLNQADYDFVTAQTLYETGRYIYSVFMCHLSIEKTLKAFYTGKFAEVPPKAHSLVYFLKKVEIEIPDETRDFIIDTLNTIVSQHGSYSFW